MFELYGIYAVAAGVLLTVAGYLWLLIRAWRLRWQWGLALLVFPPLALLLALSAFRKVTVPAIVLLIGLLLGGGTIGVNLYLTHLLDLGPRERLVDGQLHITITGWDKPATGYAVLAGKPDTVVLQMANPDVTDESLEFLRGLTKLQELDLNNTQVTDAGLAALAQLPALRVLRLRGSQVTDEGFRTHLLDKPLLTELDARETAIASKTLREWKNARPDIRRYLK
jgi:hypothetical protein